MFPAAELTVDASGTMGVADWDDLADYNNNPMDTITFEIDNNMQFNGNNDGCATLSINISPDPTVEGDETFTMSLMSIDCGNNRDCSIVAPTSATFTIVDDEVNSCVCTGE